MVSPNEQHDRCEACLQRNSKPLKWFFEVKATLGPCETTFMMTSAQYNRVSESCAMFPPPYEIAC